MTRILIAGYQHETNTFAPSLADWTAFNRGESFPAFMRGQAVIEQLSGINIPIAGFIDVAKRLRWELVPSAWAGATPSSYVTQDAFERISQAIMEDVQRALPQGLDGVYLDLHGAAVAENADDSEGELISRIRQLVGPAMPIIASLDLHANVTKRMLAQSDGLVSYRTYPHVDMADTGELAAQLMQRRLKLGRKEPMHVRRFPYLISLNAQSTWMEPAKTAYEQLLALDHDSGVMLSFCMGFPASDFDECGPVVWDMASWQKEWLNNFSKRSASLRFGSPNGCLLAKRWCRPSPKQPPPLCPRSSQTPKITRAQVATATPRACCTHCFNRAQEKSFRVRSHWV